MHLLEWRHFPRYWKPYKGSVNMGAWLGRHSDGKFLVVNTMELLVLQTYREIACRHTEKLLAGRD